MARILIGNIKGPKGDTGARGATGPQGATGPTGPMPPLTNNALATTPGVSALDAVMGKTLDDKIGKVNSDLSAKEFAFATNPDGVSNANIKCIQIGKLCVVNGTFRPRIAGTPLLLGSFAIMPKYGGYYPITAFDKVASFGTLSADGKFNCNIPTTLINEDCVVNFFYIVD